MPSVTWSACPGPDSYSPPDNQIQQRSCFFTIKFEKCFIVHYIDRYVIAVQLMMSIKIIRNEKSCPVKQ